MIIFPFLKGFARINPKLHQSYTQLPPNKKIEKSRQRTFNFENKE
jgi:hypothetical protein